LTIRAIADSSGVDLHDPPAGTEQHAIVSRNEP
jgi:hypothetical protein